MKKIAIQGVRGSFHHEAGRQVFGRGCEWVECMSFSALTASVAGGQASYGMMAVENSLVGGMLPNFSLVRESSLHVTGELYMRIIQNLMALPGTRINELKEVRSHPMALMQAEEFFHRHPHIRLMESADTAASALDIAERQLSGIGAVGSRLAAELYGMELLATSIETHKENYTRFWIISPEEEPPAAHAPVKASVAFITPHQPGSLLKVLQPLAKAGINMSMLQSLPLVGKSWEYIFHADMLFENSSEAAAMLDLLGTMVRRLWIMGVYPLMTQEQHKNNKVMNHLTLN